MKKYLSAVIILAVALLGTATLAQIRGQERIYGKVVDEQGQPIADVQIRATKVGESAPPLQAKTNNKGDWSIMGLSGGEWEVEVSKEGFQPARGKVNVVEGERTPSIEVKLAKAAPKVDPNAEIQEATKRAAALMQEKKSAEARKIYEDLLAKYPQVYQLHPFIAQTYAFEKNYDKAVEHLKLALGSDPENVQVKMLLGDIYMEMGNKEEGQKVLESIDITEAPDPYPFMNLAITLINDKRPDEAIAMMDKVIAKFPNQADAYYYRGRAYLAANRNEEARADLEKFVATAPPDARELENARKILEQLKAKN